MQPAFIEQLQDQFQRWLGAGKKRWYNINYEHCTHTTTSTGLRLSFHPSQVVVLNSADTTLVDKSIWDLASQAKMLDCMELGPEID